MSVTCDGVAGNQNVCWFATIETRNASELAVRVVATKGRYHMSKADIYYTDTDSAARCNISVHGDGHATFILRLTDIFSDRA